ncbi:MAG TPA: hypothetical protein VI603_00865 [Saprospiraceae bacterium]|nr:hypothetical protein [Saprospiraceae bacterium]
METPFVFGQQATGEDFTNRSAELAHLETNFTSGVNTILISPRRWGKSSLVKKAAQLTISRNPKLAICFVDLYNVRDEAQFYQQLAHAVINGTTRRIEELLSIVKKHLPRVMPKVSLNTPAGEFELGLQWKDIVRSPDEIIDLPQKIAADRKIKIVICIDEFQNIGSYADSLAMQKKLRSHWQQHKNVSYCLYGSQRHMLTEVFTSMSMPFYQFGEVVFLNKISEADWITFIRTRFSDTGKEIKEDDARLISSLTERHSYYVQQLAQQVWLRTSKKCATTIVHDAFDSLIRQMSLLFIDKTNSLISTQVNFLKAVIDEETHLSSKETIETYQLGSSSNVLRIKDALIRKEILDVEETRLYFLDPLYKQWLIRYYFNK